MGVKTRYNLDLLIRILFCSMPKKSSCDFQGCNATWTPDGHSMCLMHAPYIGGLHPFKPRDCGFCSTVVATLLAKENFTRNGAGVNVPLLPVCGPNYEAPSTVRLHIIMDGPPVTVVLGMDRPSPTTPSPILKALLQHPKADNPECGASLLDHMYVCLGDIEQDAPLSHDIGPDLGISQAPTLPSTEG